VYRSLYASRYQKLAGGDDVHSDEVIVAEVASSPGAWAP
jgi:hypothetical protein